MARAARLWAAAARARAVALRELRLCLRLHGWTLYISLSNSTLLPTYDFVGLKHYFVLWANRRWNIAYANLFFFSAFYVVGSMAIGLLSPS